MKTVQAACSMFTLFTNEVTHHDIGRVYHSDKSVQPAVGFQAFPGRGHTPPDP